MEKKAEKKTVFVVVLVGDDEDVAKVKEDLKMLSQNYNGNLYLDSIDDGFGLTEVRNAKL